jgi:hypothetical protein
MKRPLFVVWSEQQQVEKKKKKSKKKKKKTLVMCLTIGVQHALKLGAVTAPAVKAKHVMKGDVASLVKSLQVPTDHRLSSQTKSN